MEASASDKDDAFSAYKYQAERVCLSVIGLKKVLESNSKRIIEHKTIFEEKLKEKNTLNEKIDELMNKLSQLKSEINESWNNLSKQTEKLDCLEKINNTTLKTVCLMKEHKLLTTVREALRLNIPDKIESDNVISIPVPKKCKQKSRNVLKRSKTDHSKMVYNYTHNSNDTEKLNLFYKVIVCLCRAADVNSTLDSITALSDMTLSSQQHTAKALETLCDSLTDSLSSVNEHVSCSEEDLRVLKTSEMCIERFSNATHKDKLFKETDNIVTLDSKVSQLAETFSSNLDKLQNHNNHFIFDNCKYSKITNDEITRYLDSFQIHNIPRLSDSKDIDLSQSELLPAWEIVDLTLEVQQSLLSNPTALTISALFTSTYFYFMSTSDLVELLIYRFCGIFSENLTDEKAQRYSELGKYQVVSLIHQLLDHYSLHLGVSDSSSLISFINNFVRYWKTEFADSLLQYWAKQKTLYETLLHKQSLIVALSITEPPNNFDPLNATPALFANQLTHYESGLFSCILDNELVNQSWTKNKENAKGILHNIKHFNSIVNWIAVSILEKETIEERAKLFKYFVLVAMYLYKLNNFNGLFEVISALNNVCVFRLNLTWKEAGLHYYELFMKLASLLENNYELYRTELQFVEPPVIPYLGVMLTELTFLEDGNPTSTNNNINFFFKFGKISKAFKSFKMYKEKKHKILQQPPWKEFFVNILNSDKFDEDKYFDISLKYENTKDVDAVILPKTVKPTPEKLRLIRFHPLLRTESSDASITRRKSFKKSIHLQVAGKLLSRAESHKEIKGRPRSPSSLATITSISAMIVHPEYGISLTQRRNYNGSNVMAFNGKQGVEWIQRLIDTDLEQAIDIGSQLLQKGVIKSIKSIGAPDLFADAQIQIFNGEEYLWYTIPSLNPEPLVSPRRRASSPVNELCHLEPDKEFIEIGNLANLISRMQHPQSGILTKTKKSLFHEFKDCFTGDKCISWLVDNVPLSNRSEGIILANKMMKAGLIAHVLHNETIMKDKNIYYQFTATPASRTKSKE